MQANIDALLKKAVAARTQAYVPYSQFPIGAAVRCDDGSLFSGCNIENASYGLTICAERSAIFAAVAAGHRQLEALLLVGVTETALLPCGACRQVMAEFMLPEAPIYCAFGSGEKPQVKAYTLSELLPHAFDKESLDCD